MKTKTKKPSRLTDAFLETAADMHRIGMFDDAAYAKITMRHLGKDLTVAVEIPTPQQIRTARERARMSQAVFARHLNLTTGYLSQLERGAKRPAGPTLVLLNVIRRKGMEAIL